MEHGELESVGRWDLHARLEVVARRPLAGTSRGVDDACVPTSDRVPETRYARTPDGVSIAYHTIGDGPFDLLWFHAFMGSLEVLWRRSPTR